MANTQAIAAHWVAVLAERAELPFRSQLRPHFDAARITRLCDCGCNSFECAVPAGVDLPPLFGPLPTKSFEAAFASDADGEPIDVVVYADERGLLAGIDVHLGVSNHAPMPDNAALGRLLFTTPEL